MKTNERRRAWLCLAAVLATASAAAGCAGEIGGGDMDTGGPGDVTGGITGGGPGGTGMTSTTSSGSTSGNTTSTGTTSTGTTGTSTTSTTVGLPTSTGGCQQTGALPRRLVRLDNNKEANTITALLGANVLDAAKAAMTLPNDTYDARHREFQALFVEGGDFTSDLLSGFMVQMIEPAIVSVSPAALSTLTGCATLSDTCSNTFLKTWGAKAFRKATLSSTELMAIAGQYNTLKSGLKNLDPGGNMAPIPLTVEEATRYAIESVMLDPFVLYRAELGMPAAPGDVLTTLDPFELESELSYVLTNGPPDATGIMNAASGMVTANTAAEIDRIVGLASTVENLDQTIESYFELGKIDDNSVKDTAVFTTWSSGVRNSMYAETDNFIRNTLWQGKATDLITSNTTYLNSTLATFYGVTVPGAAADGSNFVPFQFPTSQPRAGMLTQGSVLAVKARTDNTSVVARGLYVNGHFLCQQNPMSPPAALNAVVQAQKDNKTMTEREKAAFRADPANGPCTTCHSNFDPYGLSLENYDGVGLYRTMSTVDDGAGGRRSFTIDASTTLPPAAGGAMVTGAIGMQTEAANGGLFTACLATNLLKYAFSQESTDLTANSCAVKDINKAFAGTDQSFKSLVRTVALSNSLSLRAVQ